MVLYLSVTYRVLQARDATFEVRAAAGVVAAIVAGIGVLGLWRGGRALLAGTMILIPAILLVSIVRSGTGPALASLLWVSLIAAGVGSLALRALGVKRALGGVERLGLALLLGYGVLALLVNGLAWTGLLTAPVVLAALLMLSAGIVRSWLPSRSTIERTLDSARRAWSPVDVRVPAVGLACLVLCFGSAFLWAIAPSVHWDALWYHLPLAARDAAHEGFAPLPYYAASHYIGLAHALYSLSFILDGPPLPALLHLSFSLITTMLVFGLARRRAGDVAGWTAAVAFASMPMVTWLAGTAYVDHVVTAYIFGAYCALLHWWESRGAPGADRWLILAGACGGMALGAKLTAGLYLLPLVLLAAAGSLSRRRGMRPLAASMAGLVVPVLFFSLPWLARNWSETSPAAPRCKPLFEQAGVPGADPAPQSSLDTSLFAYHRDQLVGNQGKWGYYGVAEELRQLAWLPVELVVDRRAIDDFGYGGFGIVPLLVVASPFVGGASWRARGPLLFLAVSTSVLWFHFSGYARYLLPAIPLLTVMATLGLPGIVQRFEGCRGARWIGLACGVAALGYLAATRGVDARWGQTPPDGYPYRYALGLETRDQFLGRALGEYRAFQFINDELGTSARVLSVFTAQRFYLLGELDDGTAPYARCLAQFPPGPELARTLNDLGYQFILVDWNAARRGSPLSRLPYANRQFLDRYTEEAFVDRRVAVYRLRTE